MHPNDPCVAHEPRAAGAADAAPLGVLYTPIADLTARRVVAVAASAPGPDVTTEHLVTAAARQVARWSRHGLPLQLVVSLPAWHVAASGMAAGLRRLLEAAELPAQQLTVEVAEDGLVGNASAVAAGMRQLTAIGAEVSLNAFGSGDSSLVLLRRLPLSSLVVDVGFLDQQGDHADAVLTSIIRVAGALDVRCEASGVDTDTQQAAVARTGCRRARGAAVAVPVMAADLPAALDDCEAALPHLPAPVAVAARRRQLDPAVAAQMQQMYDSGASLPTIAAALNRSCSPHPDGVRWHANAVARHLAAARRHSLHAVRTD